jgi:hypothetical protein
MSTRLAGINSSDSRFHLFVLRLLTIATLCLFPLWSAPLMPLCITIHSCISPAPLSLHLTLMTMQIRPKKGKKQQAVFIAHSTIISWQSYFLILLSWHPSDVIVGVNGHDQLYTALSRVWHRQDIRTLWSEGNEEKETLNVVYSLLLL